jgi:hypothetical protein
MSLNQSRNSLRDCHDLDLSIHDHIVIGRNGDVSMKGVLLV